MTSPSGMQVQIYVNYDKAFIDKMHSVLFYTRNENGISSQKKVTTVFATPERAFAQVAKQMKRHTSSLAGISDADLIKNIPLPILSVSRLAGNVDQNRYIRYHYKRLQYTDDETKYVGAQRPQPWTFNYQVDSWARELQTLDDLQNQMILWLRSTEFWMYVNHPVPIGRVNCLVEFDGMTDNSVLETDSEQRALRRTYSFKVYGWLCYVPQEYGIVEQINLDYYEYDDDNVAGTLIDQDIVTEDS